jgi:transketolase
MMTDFDPKTTTGIDASRIAQCDVASRDERVFAVEADLGDCGGLAFAAEFPDRYRDFGIAEASAVGAAAGLAMRGKRPVLNTFGSFAIMRASEQVRLDICYNNVPVVIAAMFTGVAAGFSGPTHHTVEDIAIARAFPNMTVLAPADANATYAATVAALAHDGPVYIRLGVEPGKPVYAAGEPFVIGKGTLLRPGRDLTIVACGLTIVPNALDAAEQLAAYGVDARVIDMATIKPIDRDLLIAAARETGAVVTIEEHSTIGGLGSAVAEVLAEHVPVPLRMLGLPDAFSKHVCSYDDQLAAAGLDPVSITKAVLAWNTSIRTSGSGA